MLKLLLFDIGNVLIDYKDSFKNASKEQKIPFEYFGEAWRDIGDSVTLGHITPKEYYDKVLTKSGVEGDKNYDFLDSWVRDEKKIQPTYELIKKISSEYKIGLLSDIEHGLVPLLIERHILPFVDYDYQFLSCNLGVRKPDRRIYEHVINTVDVKPEEIFFTDDKEENLVIPKEMGWSTYLFDENDPEKSVEEINRILK